MAVPLPQIGDDPWGDDLNAALTYVDGQTIAEIDRATQAEADLQDAIDAVPGAASVTAEVTRATAAETALTSAVSAEAASRVAGDNANATALSAETTARTTAVATNAAAIATEITDRTTAISTEATARATGDATNATAISTEATARATAITAAVATETTARTAADTTHANAIAAETSARTTAVAAATAAAVAKAGDTMTGALTLPGNPGAALEAATKQYVDAFASGTIIHAAVRAATTANGTLATAYAAGNPIDGVTLVTGDRILIKDQTAGAENGVYCLDEKTEILTTEGFKNHIDLRGDEEVLTLNMETGLSEWEPVLSVHRFEVQDIEALSIEGRSHSSLSTLNHRWPVRHSVDHGLSGLEQILTIRESAQLATTDSLIPSAPCATLPTVAKYDDAFVELTAWFVTEGTIRVNRSGTVSTGVRIGQSQRVNPRYVDRIRACLRSLWGNPTNVMRRPRGGEWLPEWRERTGLNHGMIVFDLNTVAGEALCRVAPDRVVSGGFIASLTASQLRLFVETCVDADGHRNRKHGQVSFTQKSAERLAPVQMAATLLGIPTSVSAGSGDVIVMTLGKRTGSQPHAKGSSRVRFSGTVWCPRTGNGTWLARRRGSVYFTGNTVNATGAPTRALAEDSTGELGQGARFFVTSGTVNGGSAWVQSVATPTIGTTPLVFVQSSGATSVTAGAGITVAGNSVAINTATTVDKTTAQTLTNKTLTSPVINTPTGIVKGDVGLGNVDNTSNVTERAATATLTNKTLTSPAITTPTGLAKTDVGLTNVDNTSDATKNAATATLTNKTLTSPVLNTGVSGTAVELDATFPAAAASDTKVPSQKAVKTALGLKASSVNPVFTGTMTAPAVAVTGITGAPTPVRFVGGTTGGKPTSGTFALNDMIVDATGTVWICTLPGTVGVTTVPPSPVFVEQGNNNVLFALGAATQYSDGLFGQIPTLVSSDPAKLNITTANAVTTLDVSGMAPVFPITNRVTTTFALPNTGTQGAVVPDANKVSVPGMGVPLLKNSFYEIEAMVFYVATAAADLSINFIEPVGTISGLWVLDGLKLGGTTTDESVRRVAVAWIFPISVGGVTTNTPFLFARISGTIEVGANDGTLQMTASQNTVDNTSTTSIWRGSRIKAIKI